MQDKTDTTGRTLSFVTRSPVANKRVQLHVDPSPPPPLLANPSQKYPPRTEDAAWSFAEYPIFKTAPPMYNSPGSPGRTSCKQPELSDLALGAQTWAHATPEDSGKPMHEPSRCSALPLGVSTVEPAFKTTQKRASPLVSVLPYRFKSVHATPPDAFLTCRWNSCASGVVNVSPETMQKFKLLTNELSNTPFRLHTFKKIQRREGTTVSRVMW